MSATTLAEPVVITAGAYMRLRREAEGLSIEDVAKVCASSPVDLDAAVAAIEDAEADRSEFTPADLQKLRLAFPFAISVYWTLARGVLVTSGICHQCGCTWLDACLDPETSFGCAWADQARTLCTSCHVKAQ